MAHLTTIEAWPFGFTWLISLNCMDFILSCVVFPIMLDDVSLWLAQSIVGPVIEAVVGESEVPYVHWDWCVIVLPRCVRGVILRGGVPLRCLVLSSSREERLLWSLLPECILEGTGWLYSVVSTYAFCYWP